MSRIKFSLSERGIEKAIKELSNFRKKFLTKVVEFRKRVAEEIQSEAAVIFNSSTIDGTSRKADVNVEVNTNGNVTLVIASGEDAVWVEFGAGVYYNTSPGTSPNPLAPDGFTIGSYGKGFGKYLAWGYYKEDKLITTRGTKATMPMYRAYSDVLLKIAVIAKEVFQ